MRHSKRQVLSFHLSARKDASHISTAFTANPPTENAAHPLFFPAPSLVCRTYLQCVTALSGTWSGRAFRFIWPSMAASILPFTIRAISTVFICPYSS